ncbi:MAG: YdeI/OmpD-associated family protein [Cytophagales bacterium]|nr:YdeI/OmpD-associated family protein [Cytophagales bacterium]
MTKHFTSSLSASASTLWNYHLIVPNEVVNYYFDQNIKRFICIINGIHAIPTAFMPKGSDVWFIKLNKTICNKLKLKLGDIINIELSPDSSTYGMPMPEQFNEVLAQYDTAFKHFENLTPGKQRTLIYLVNMVQNSEIRLQKSMVIAQHLDAQNGKINFKLLYQEMKNKNMY